METDKEKVLSNFLDDEEERQEKIDSDKKKMIKSDNSIIERVDKIIITENGKQLLREWY